MSGGRDLWRLGWVLAMGVPAALLAVLVLAPIVTLLVTLSWDAAAGLFGDARVRSALGLSLGTSAVTLAAVLLGGTPLAWGLSRAQGRWVRAVESALELPLVVPPSVLGVALLIAFGRAGLLGQALSGIGIEVAFSTAAVVLAQLVVAAPLYVQTATAAFRGIDPELLVVARTLGAPPWRCFARVALPLAAPGLAAGAALAWARALGEFGATLLFAGNRPGHTQTLPLLIYATLESDVGAAQALAAALLLVSYVLLLVLRRPLARGFGAKY